MNTRFLWNRKCEIPSILTHILLFACPTNCVFFASSVDAFHWAWQVHPRLPASSKSMVEPLEMTLCTSEDHLKHSTFCSFLPLISPSFAQLFALFSMFIELLMRENVIIISAGARSVQRSIRDLKRCIMIRKDRERRSHAFWNRRGKKSLEEIEFGNYVIQFQKHPGKGKEIKYRKGKHNRRKRE